jgi:hypothetical protein
MEKKEFKFTSMDFGPVKEGKTVEVKPGSDFDIDSYGTMFAQHVQSDEGRFVYTRLKGDFDVQVRVESIFNEAYNLAQASLLARKDLDPKSILVSTEVANNEYIGASNPFEFQIRIKHGGNLGEGWGHPAGTHGNVDAGWGAEGAALYTNGYCEDHNHLFPRTFPYVWLRLRRTGNVYAAYYKEQRIPLESWSFIAQWEIDLGQEPYVGLAPFANHQIYKVWGDFEALRKTRTQVRFRDLVILN